MFLRLTTLIKLRLSAHEVLLYITSVITATSSIPPSEKEFIYKGSIHGTWIYQASETKRKGSNPSKKKGKGVKLIKLKTNFLL